MCVCVCGARAQGGGWRGEWRLRTALLLSGPRASGQAGGETKWGRRPPLGTSNKSGWRGARGWRARPPPHLGVRAPCSASQPPDSHSLRVPGSFFIPGQPLSPWSPWAPVHSGAAPGTYLLPERRGERASGPRAARGVGGQHGTQFCCPTGSFWELRPCVCGVGLHGSLPLPVSSEDGTGRLEFLAP